MKYLKPLLERKTLGDLYHLLDYEKMLFISETNSIKSYLAGGGKISLTRNKMMNNYLGDSPQTIFKLVMDGDRLSDKYKIRPFSYLTRNAGRLSEWEEQINTPIIPNIFSYIKKVVIIKENVESLMYLKWEKKILSDYFTNIGASNGTLPDMLKTVINMLKQHNHKLYVQDGSIIKEDDKWLNYIINFPIKQIETKKIILYRGKTPNKNSHRDFYMGDDSLIDLDGNIILKQLVIGYHGLKLDGFNFIEYDDNTKYDDKEIVFDKYKKNNNKSKYIIENTFKPYIIKIRKLDNNTWKIDDITPLEWRNKK